MGPGFDELLEAVREYDLQWAMLSPPIDHANSNLLAPLAERTNVRPIILQGAFVLRTDPDLK